MKNHTSSGNDIDVAQLELLVEQAMLHSMQSEHLRSAGALFQWGSDRVVAMLSWQNPELIPCTVAVRLSGPKIDDVRLTAYYEQEDGTMLIKNPRVVESFQPTGEDLEGILYSLVSEAHIWTPQDVEQDVSLTHLPTQPY